MWRSFKSWWYWNMPDWEDLVFYVGMSLVIITMFVCTYLSYQDHKSFVAECDAKGGVSVQGAHRNYYCIDKGSIK